MPWRSPQLEEMAATNPANQKPTQHVAPAMPQQPEPNFTRTTTGPFLMWFQV